jgi:hypothetical protein
MQDILLRLIENKTSWLGLILIVVLVSHTLNRALHLPSGGLIPTLEFFVTAILGVILLHEIYGEPLFGSRQNSGGFNLLVAFMVFTIFSGILAIIDRRIR